MAKKYLTPDFDVTVYEIGDILTEDGPSIVEFDPNKPDVGDGDWSGPLN